MGHELDVAVVIQFDPREMTPGPAACIDAMARNTSGIEIDGALPVPLHGAALPGSMPQAMVHVAKDHQGQGPLLADQTDRFLQVLVAPITGRTFPITAAEISRFTPQPGWTAMGKQHQGTICWCLKGCCTNALGRLKQEGNGLWTY